MAKAALISWGPGWPGGSPMTDLAIIIVNWNVRAMLADCLRSVEADVARSGLSVQLWVVDNASSDGSVDMVRRDFPHTRLIASSENLGFAAGNNAALRAMGFGQPPADGAQKPLAVLLLNPDTVIHPGTLVALAGFFEEKPKAGLAGARLVFGDGSFQHSAFDFPGLWQLAIEMLPLPGRLAESKLNGRYRRALYQQGRPFKIGHPLGAAMAVRSAAIDQVGLLDEQYHMYVEEVDWSKRLVAAGWEAYCVPAATVTHFGGQSTTQVQSTSFINLWTSRRRFYTKHYGPLKVWLAAQLVRIGLRRRAAEDQKAAERGELSEAELAARRRSYQAVAEIWRRPGSQDNKRGQETHV